MIGIGAWASCKPHTAEALTGWYRLPVIMLENHAGTFSVIAVWIKGWGANEDGGAVTPVTEPGKVTSTPFDSVVASKPAPL